MKFKKVDTYVERDEFGVKEGTVHSYEQVEAVDCNPMDADKFVSIELFQDTNKVWTFCCHYLNDGYGDNVKYYDGRECLIKAKQFGRKMKEDYDERSAV